MQVGHTENVSTGVWNTQVWTMQYDSAGVET